MLRLHQIQEMDELSQWCEIDGHKIIEDRFEYGLMGLSPTTQIIRRCSNCDFKETKYLVPYEASVYLDLNAFQVALATTVLKNSDNV